MNVKHLLLVLSLMFAPQVLWAQDAETSDSGSQVPTTDTSTDKKTEAGGAEEDGAEPECD